MAKSKGRKLAELIRGGSDLATGSISGTEIADDAITSDHIGDGEVHTAALADSSVTNAKIADNAIDSEHYADGSIDTAHIADNAVTAAKIAAGAAVPSQSGQSGKYLTTDGTNASWGTITQETASSILTKVKTVDGASSGLDADLLDGQQGSYYTGYTDTAISNLVDTAPGTLDTLNELAAALGDDANFSTTVTNSIATKLPKAGGTMTGAITFASGQTFDGRDVSVDGAKLDGIESGATADQTAAEILTAIKTVDGSGSGLDADTLDGNQATAFATSAQGTKADTAYGWGDHSSAGYVTTAYTQSASNPTISVNPSEGAGAIWVNYSSKKIYICYDATTNANKWINVHDSTDIIQPNQAPTNPTNTSSFPSSANKNTSFTFTFSGATDSISGSGTPSVTHYKVDNISSSYLTVSSAEVSAGSAHTFSISNSLGADTAVSFRVRAKDNNGAYSSGVTVSFTMISITYTAATGGSVTTSGNTKKHTFTSSGTLSVSSVGTDSSYTVFIIGGGGGGGNFAGGGGGAGGAVETSGTFSSTGNYTVTVGAGGGGYASGSNSSFNGNTGYGGGRGGSNNTGANGGCGGGGSNNNGAGTGSQGGDGGYGQGGCTSETGGGGGGMGANGAYGYCNSTGGAGGNGSTWSFAGGTYGGGGGGGSVWSYSLSNGGSGGGGKGGTYNNQGGCTAGTANTGGGGGGNSRSGGQAGGSGRVVIGYTYQ